MLKHIKIVNYNNDHGICFYIQNDEVLELGERMNEVCEDAYMNGYNWEALINCYLRENAPDLLDGLAPDPEAGMYAAYYSGTPDNEGRAKRLADIIAFLLNDEDKLFGFLKAHESDIEWD